MKKISQTPSTSPQCSKEQRSQDVDSVEANFKGGTGQRRMETPSVKPGTAHQCHCRRVSTIHNFFFLFLVGFYAHQPCETTRLDLGSKP